MNKLNLFDFISKLSANKEAQNSIITILSKLISNAKSSANNQNEDVKNEKITPNNSSVYSSPPTSLYDEMIKRHNEISKNIDNNLK